jgi:hypothetical protein
MKGYLLKKVKKDMLSLTRCIHFDRLHFACMQEKMYLDVVENKSRKVL